MRRLATGVAVMASIGAWTAAAAFSPVPADEAEDVAKGRELAHALCAQCHLNEGQGEKQGPMGVPSCGGSRPCRP
jgi:mono/diheme cytochrome c family protein